jgi:hypothetical protein
MGTPHLDNHRPTGRGDRFVAPCVAGGSVHARVGGRWRVLRAAPDDHEGWAVLRPVDHRRAWVEGPAPQPLIDAWLARTGPAVRLVLIRRLRGRSWLAWPAEPTDFRRQAGPVRPVVLHLVHRAWAFDTVVGRWDGGNLWFEAVASRLAPRQAEDLRIARGRAAPKRWAARVGMSPALNAAYAVDVRLTPRPIEDVVWSRGRLRRTLWAGGEALDRAQQGAGHWQVDWRDGEGGRQSSAIGAAQLTALSVGLALPRRDPGPRAGRTT